MAISKSTILTILVYAAILALAAFALEWLQFQFFLKSYPVETYVILIAAAFTLLGIWLGTRLTSRKRAPGFERNEAAMKSLGISKREIEVLEALALGQSNKEIARALKISPNTVKTHVAKLYEKLDASGRVSAIREARALYLIA